MTESVASLFARALDLAQKGQKAEAYALLGTLVQTQAHDPNLWLWLAFTAPDLTIATVAVDHAARLSPDSASVTQARQWLLAQQPLTPKTVPSFQWETSDPPQSTNDHPDWLEWGKYSGPPNRTGLTIMNAYVTVYGSPKTRKHMPIKTPQASAMKSGSVITPERLWTIRLDGQTHRIKFQHWPVAGMAKMMIDSQSQTTVPNLRGVIPQTLRHISFTLGTHAAVIELRGAGILFSYDLYIDNISVTTDLPLQPKPMLSALAGSTAFLCFLATLAAWGNTEWTIISILAAYSCFHIARNNLRPISTRHIACSTLVIMCWLGVIAFKPFTLLVLGVGFATLLAATILVFVLIPHVMGQSKYFFAASIVLWFTLLVALLGHWSYTQREIHATAPIAPPLATPTPSPFQDFDTYSGIYQSPTHRLAVMTGTSLPPEILTTYCYWDRIQNFRPRPQVATLIPTRFIAYLTADSGMSVDNFYNAATRGTLAHPVTVFPNELPTLCFVQDATSTTPRTGYIMNYYPPNGDIVIQALKERLFPGSPSTLALVFVASGGILDAADFPTDPRPAPNFPDYEPRSDMRNGTDLPLELRTTYCEKIHTGFYGNVDKTTFTVTSYHAYVTQATDITTFFNKPVQDLQISLTPADIKLAKEDYSGGRCAVSKYAWRPAHGTEIILFDQAGIQKYAFLKQIFPVLQPQAEIVIVAQGDFSYP